MSETGKVHISDFEKRQRLSDVYLKLRQRAKYDEEFEPSNPAAKILRKAEENEDLYRLNEEKPVFYKLEKEVTQEIHLGTIFKNEIESSEEYLELLKNPTEFIENLPLVDRGIETHKGLPEGKTIGEIIDEPYDISRVKIVDFCDKKVLVKRVEHRKVLVSDTEEYKLAKKSFDVGIPTPKPFGYIKDRGNTYLLFEYLESTTSLLEFRIQNSDYFSTLRKKDVTQYYLEGNEWKEYYLIDLSDSICADIYRDYEYHRREMFKSYSEEMINYIIKIKGSLASSIYDLVCRKNIEISKQDFCFEYLKMILSFFDLEELIELNRKKDYSLEENFLVIYRQVFEQLDKKFVNPDEINKYNTRVNKRRGDFESEGFEKHVDEYETEKFGAPYTKPYEEFIKNVTEKMKQAGIKHVDIEPRNILMKMDKDGKIEPGEDGKPQFYIIDWEMTGVNKQEE